VRWSLTEELHADRAGHVLVPFGARVEVVAAVHRGRETRRLLRVAGRRVEIDDRVEAARPADPGAELLASGLEIRGRKRGRN
jgi:hypothetical protein